MRNIILPQPDVVIELLRLHDAGNDVADITSALHLDARTVADVLSIYRPQQSTPADPVEALAIDLRSKHLSRLNHKEAVALLRHLVERGALLPPPQKGASSS